VYSRTSNALLAAVPLSLSFNSAGFRGGALALNDNTSLAINEGARVTGNSVVNGLGGGLAMNAGALYFGAKTIVFSNNSAQSGSALYLASSTTSVVTFATASAASSAAASKPGALVIDGNKCRGAGGTVYWITDALFAPAAKDLFGFGSSTNYLLAGYAGYRRVVWGRNSDLAGSGIATQAMFFVSPPPGNGSLPSRGVGVGVRGGRAVNGTLAPFAVEHYYQALTPAVKLLVTDLYGQVNTSDSTTVVTVTVVPGAHCSGGGSISGVVFATAVRGVVTFANLTAFCFPGGNMTLQYTGTLNGFER